MSVSTDHSDQPLAIIGMACRLPGAAGLEQYWQLVSQGRSAVGEVPAERLDQELYYDPQKGIRGKSYSNLAAVLADRHFDHGRCPIPVELLQSVDNTHLLMTGVAADALRHAGLDPFNLQPKNTAIFIGHAQGSSHLGELTYRAYLDDAVALLGGTPGFSELPVDEQARIERELIERIQCRLPPHQANARHLNCNMVAGTIAKAFGLTGPWLALNSACASSLHAMLLGARALQRGRADMVIVGGASDCKSDSLVLFSAAQTLSTGDSRPFDSEADGLIMSEGYVALVMKTLERALADGDPIQAVVRGLGVASDGRGKSLWAPRKEGQMKAMQRAYRSGVDMSTVQYLEAHATSTQVGDATELETLGEVLGPKFPPGKKIPITSVKANIGHTLEAAGVAGVIKTVLCMQHQTIPPAINIRSLNTKVDWSTSPYYIPQAAAPWQAQTDGSPRRAAVNAFGIGGLNMHVVLDEFTDASARQLVAQARPKVAESAEDRAVAVIGMGCVFPGTNGLPKFWEALVGGSDPKTSPTAARWTQKALANQQRKAQTIVGGFITDFQYDWRKRKVPPKQVNEADPLQFMLLEAAEQALADAGYDTKPLDRERCGVVVGTEFGGDFCDHLEIGLRLPEMQHVLAELLGKRGVPAEKITSINARFAERLLAKWPSLVDETGSFTSSTLASRITKTLDLAGGAVAIDSGSTSALSGLSVCVDMLLSGDNDMMICAAGQRRMGPRAFETLDAAGLLSASNPPRNLLDAAYDGVVPAEGVGVVVLKRLADARRDGDRIHAVIRGLGIAHHSSSAEALRLAADQSCRMAGIHPSEVTLVELDTDERLGPRGEELQALATVHAATNRQTPLVVGSVTAQFGHLGGAAGMAALMKASLEIEHGQSVPAVALHTAAAALGHSPNTMQAARGIQKLAGRRVGALACWSKGLACHLILEDAAGVASASAAPSKTVAARRAVASIQAPITVVHPAAPRICRFGGASFDELAASIDLVSRDVASAWQSAAASQFAAGERFRLAVVADSAEALARKLHLARPQLNNPAARQVLEQQGAFYREMPSVKPRVVYVFPGQGSQYDGMLRDLALNYPAATTALGEIDATMTDLGYPTFSKLAWETPTQLGSDVWSTQVAMLLADAIALAALKDLGIAPDLVLGHSYGEFVALYAAGAWDLPTAVRMTRARCEGILAVASAGGGMLATNAPAEVVEGLFKGISGVLYVANFNAPDQLVVGGKRPQLEALARALEAQSHQARILAVPAAFHTPLMAGASRLLEQQMRAAELHPLRVPMISTVTNVLVRDVTEIRRNLAAQLTTPVRYAQLIARLAAEQPTVFVEVGPQQTLTRLTRRILDAGVSAIACDNPKRAGLEPLLCVQALLECLGVHPANAVDRPKSQPGVNRLAQSIASSANSITSNESSATTTMNDNIPHFDATERRRAKMRGGAGGQSAAASNGARHSAPAAKPPATAPAANRAAPPPRPAPDKAAPAVAASPTPAKSPAPARASAVSAPPLPAAPRIAPAVATPAAVEPAYGTMARNGNGVHNGDGVHGGTGRNGDAAHNRGTNGDHTRNGDAQRHAAVPSQAALPAGQRASIAPAELESFLINFVVEQTGYPPEVVELDADLEADLGVDSIKKAQLFGELQEYFDIGTTGGSLSLDDFPTLRHVLNFLQSTAGQASPAAVPSTMRSAPTAEPTATSMPPAHAAAEPDVNGAPASARATAAPGPAELESFLINFVVEQTGYPPEVVELDADLEADLGVDSIKKAQLFGELQEYFDIGTSTGNVSLDDFPTLRHVLNFLQQAGSPTPAAPTLAGPVAAAPVEVPSPVAATAEPVSPPTVAPAGKSTANAAELESFLINFVVEQTGYPPEVVELDADLEADLGVDSIKKAQLFGELQEYFDIGTTGGSLSLDDFPTLRHVLTFLVNASAGSSAPEGVQQVSATVEPALAVAVAHHPAPAPVATTAASNAVELESFLINFVVEQTGYPPEVVELDADLEADLGVDSIKKAQLFGELQEYFDIGVTGGNLSLDDFPTLRHVLDFLLGANVASGTSAGATATMETPVAGQHSSSPLAETNGHAPGGCAAAITPERFEGTPYELGWVRGRRFKNEIRRVLRTYAERVNGQLDERSGYELLSADELDELQGMADSVEVPLGNLVAHHSELSRELASWLGEPSVHGALSGTKTRPSTMREAALPELPSTGITSRFVLEMRDAPLAGDIPAEPAWTGAAIVLGANAQADALRSRLRDSGVEVHDLPITDEIDATLAALEAICLAGPTPHLFITTSCDGLFGDVNDEQSWSERRHEAMTLPFFVCQKWLGLASAGKWLDRATLVAVTALGGDFGFLRGAEVPTGGAVAGLLKAITIEYAIMQDLRNLQVKVIDAPLDAATDQLVDHIFRELASGNLDYEVAFVGDRRQVPFAVEDAVHGSRSSDIRSGAVWVVTGGARGITAACALELGRRFGLKLHLLGTTALPEIDPAWRDLEGERLQQLKASVMIAARKDGRPAAQAWRQVEKDLEIDRSLRAFAAAGVEVTYHACDVSDRAAVERTLARIRAIDGPIEGVLHGAGIDRSCRFDRKQRDVVLATIGAKVDGAAHLMALTRRDPIRHFIGFGSISGRLGSFGQADYCLASDMHCKLIGAYRRERPWIKAVGFHWHPWDEVGMAARPETKNVLEGKSDLHLMPLAEGIAHLVRELAAGAPAPEVLITERRHWQRFAAGIGKLAERTPGAKSSPVVAPPAAKVVANAPPNHAASDVEAAADADHSVELHTHRCQLRTLVAPLSPNSPKLPALDGPAWILGENAAALALAARLSALGCGVRHIRVGDVDATLAEVDRLWAEEPAKHLFLMTGRDEVAGDLLDADVMRRRRDDGILLPFLVAQRWYKLLVARPELGIGTLAAAVSLGGDFGFGASARVPDGGALAGLLKAVHIEDSRRDTSRVRAKVIDAPANESAATFVDALLNELAASEPEVEVCWSHGTRRVVRPLPAAAVSLPKASVPRGGTWVVTGGARGITAIAARELARRYGWKLHLVGKSPAPQADAAWRHYGEAEMKSLKTSVARGAVAEGRSPSEAWDRVMKDVEIFNNLHSFAEAGVQATYHACDIGDRAALAAVLDAVRRQDGPITGILHGAGVIDPSRFEGKRRQIVSSLVGAKFDGTLNLMALTARDPLAFFIGFGSISGRFGGNGLTDYAAGNDALAKLIDWFAGTRRDCRSACIHWESWEGSGMATLPRYAWGPKSVMNMKYMLPEEGVRRLEQELAAGLPDSEVLYTFGDFYPMFYPHEQRPLGPFVPGQLTAAKPAAASESQVTEPPLLLNMRRDAEGLTADVPLDPIADSFLAQHRLRDKALLPVVVGLEALAEAAALASGKRTIAFQNVQMLDGLLFHTERPVTAAARSAPEVNGTLACRLTCDFRNRLGGLIQKDRPYLSANVIVADEVPAWAANFTAQPGAWTEFAYPEGAAVYHGPVFRGVTATSFDRQGGFGRIVSLPLADLTGTVRAARWTIPSCVLDAAFYACGIHLWTHGQGAVSLPRAIERLRLGRTPRAGETCLVHFTCRDIATDAACYDFTVIGEDRAVIVQAEGYRKVILARGGAQ